MDPAPAPAALPPGYVLFATNSDGWQFWVPPANAATNDRLRAFRFLHPEKGLIAKSGPAPSVSVGEATVDAANHCFSAYDVENDYNERVGRKPHIRGFMALWFKYLISISGSLNCTAIQLDSVVNPDLARHLLSLGFNPGHVGSTYVGQCAAISPKVNASCTRKGWT